MKTKKKIEFPDLTRTFPRSSTDMIAGIVHLPRMIDKARAANNNALGEYVYPCPLDKIVLGFLKSNAEIFSDVVNREEDPKVLQWAQEMTRFRTPTEKEILNRQILERRPGSAEQWEYFNEMRDQIDPSRTDIETWVELSDLEEGRDVALLQS
ncbi:MAG: hypothetical protein NPINA01_16230 [Nitrospinaceae bacterium]|nr:MAG: hypothetical protein NPINA01_16230 [Nitrospinaceae bacterium]